MRAKISNQSLEFHKKSQIVSQCSQTSPTTVAPVTRSHRLGQAAAMETRDPTPCPARMDPAAVRLRADTELRPPEDDPMAMERPLSKKQI